MKMIHCLGLGAVFGLALTQSAEAKLVRYELTATRGVVNLSGKRAVDFALMLNGSIPAPTLEFNEGDDAEIVVKNEIPGEELSIHWHGILLPPEMDGVPYVTTPTILPGRSLTFKYRIRQHGTYWYHSHTNVQEQKGLYGAMVIHPRDRKTKANHDVVAILSDWSDENATQILKNLRKDGDYYLYKKGTMRSWLGALQAGALGTFVDNEWTRMGGMDYSDVGYDAFLINGKRELQLVEAHPGQTVRIRIINAAASTYFHIALGDKPMRVISADGVDISPTDARELLMGMAETYDLLFTVPEHKNYELRVTAQDGTGSTSAWIGMGPKVTAPVKRMPDLYASMDHGVDHSAHAASAAPSKHDSHSSHAAHSGHSSHAAHSGHSSHAAHSGHSGHTAPAPKITPAATVETLTVDALRSPVATAFQKQAHVHDVKLVLDGDMERYVWHINGKAIHEERNIVINEGDVVRFTLVNHTMMHHPMHLHGHFFRVVNTHGEHSPLKHTVDVAPHTSRVIEFLANEPGEWMLHCHNLYHLKTGMARVVKYSTYTPRPELAAHQKHDPHLHDHWYAYSSALIASSFAEGYARFSQTWNQLEARVEGHNSADKNFSLSEKWEVEADLLYRRWFGRFLTLTAGGIYQFDRLSAAAGVSYLLPWLVESQLLVDHRGDVRLDLEKRFQWTKSIYTEAEVTARLISGPNDTEYKLSLMYGPSWRWSVGAIWTGDLLSAGIRLQF